MADSPYSIDFLQQIKNVNFGGNNYVLITIGAAATNQGQTPPPNPSVSLVPGANEKVLTRQEKPTQSKIPPDQPNTIYFVWVPSATPFPDPSNFDNVVVNFSTRSGAILAVKYAFQFGGGNGFGSLADAQAAAQIDNSPPNYEPNPSEPSLTSFFPPNSTPSTAANLEQFIPFNGTAFGAQLLVPSKDPGSASVSFSGSYLISIPAAATRMGISVSVSGDESAGASISASVFAGFNGQATIAALQAATPDASATIKATSATLTTTAPAKGKGTVSLA